MFASPSSTSTTGSSSRRFVQSIFQRMNQWRQALSTMHHPFGQYHRLNTHESSDHLLSPSTMNGRFASLPLLLHRPSILVILFLCLLLFLLLYPWYWLFQHWRVPGSMCQIQAPPGWSCRTEWVDYLEQSKCQSFQHQLEQYQPIEQIRETDWNGLAHALLVEEIASMNGLELLTTNSMDYWDEMNSHTSTSSSHQFQLEPISSLQLSTSSSPSFGGVDASPPATGSGHMNESSGWSLIQLQRWKERSRWSETTLTQLRAMVVKQLDQSNQDPNIHPFPSTPSETKSGVVGSIHSDSHPRHPHPLPLSLTLFDLDVMVVTGLPNHRSRCDYIMSSWGETFSHTSFHVISDSLDLDGLLPIIPIPNSSGYEGSQRKWIGGWKEVWSIQPRKKWYLTFDDDAYVSTSNVLELLSQFDPSQPLVIGGICLFDDLLPSTTTPPNPPLQRVCGGGGWIFSYAAVELIEPYLDTCQTYESPLIGSIVFSDVFIGACLKEKLGTRLVWMNSWEIHFHGDRPKHERLSDQHKRYLFERVNTYHYMQPFMIGDLFRLEMSYTPRFTRKELHRLQQLLGWSHQQLANKPIGQK